MSIKKHIPNLFTLANLLCGSLLIVVIFHQKTLALHHINVLHLMALLISLSLFFDLLDGMLARILNVKSEIGLQLDSLADMVSFGLAPGLLIFASFFTITDDATLSFQENVFAFTGLLIPLFSAYRLAKFNVEDAGTTYFKGLATPAHSIFIFGLFVLLQKHQLPIAPWHYFALAALVVCSSFLLISNLPLFSFKAKFRTVQSFLPQGILLMIAVVLFLTLGLSAFTFIIPIYILLSILFRKTFVYEKT